MRMTTWLLTLVPMSVLLAACGAPPPPSTVAQAVMPAASASATAPSTPTKLPATPTTAPTLAPTEVATATIEPAAIDTVAATEAPAASGDVNDTPRLTTDSAPPTPAPPNADAVQPSEPVRMQIPAIGLDYKPVSVGLDQNRIPIVPKHDVGWYNLSAMPGQGENIVFWGHVLRFKDSPNIPAPFARVKELKLGAEVILTTATGQQRRYKVTRTVQVTPDQVQYILPVGKEQITLVSCIGANVIANGEFSKKYRLVTIAEPVS